MTIEELKKELEETNKEIEKKTKYARVLKLRLLKRDLLEYGEITDVVFGEIQIIRQILEIWNSAKEVE